jgi:hypothetical protein
VIDGSLMLGEGGEDGEDILDDKVYSIQQAKLLAEQDSRQALAEKIKNKMRQQIQELRL